MKRRSAGLTLIEMVVVIAILAILLIIAMISWRNHINKARDSQKKDDLQRLSIAFEDYFSDYSCYPAEDVLISCGDDSLSPYLDKIPCDPVTKKPYCYIPDVDNPACPKNFRILTPLKNTSDPVIDRLDCGGEAYCGWEDQCVIPEENIFGFNYGIASTNIAVANPAEASPGPSPAASPSPSPQVIYYYCQSGPPLPNCTEYNPKLWDCQPSYTDPNCTGSNHCTAAGSCTGL